MGDFITLTAEDGHELQAYKAEAEGTPQGGIVVLQEIFGVNVHIRDVCDRWAAVGYTAVAPQLFDRFERGIDLGYEPDDVTKGRALKATGYEHLDQLMLDVDAARGEAAKGGKVGITGFCWGGAIAWISACRLPFDAAATFYGGEIHQYSEETANCPTIMHFGELDQGIPMENVEITRGNQPDVTIFTYNADHGFNCDRRKQYDPASASIAGMRTVRFFDNVLAA